MRVSPALRVRRAPTRDRAAKEVNVKKTILRFIVLATLVAFATPSWACPKGYVGCGSTGKLCCPK
jgi:hypothetical protein